MVAGFFLICELRILFANAILYFLVVCIFWRNAYARQLQLNQQIPERSPLALSISTPNTRSLRKMYYQDLTTRILQNSSTGNSRNLMFGLAPVILVRNLKLGLYRLSSFVNRGPWGVFQHLERHSRTNQNLAIRDSRYLPISQPGRNNTKKGVCENGTLAHSIARIILRGTPQSTGTDSTRIVDSKYHITKYQMHFF